MDRHLQLKENLKKSPHSDAALAAEPARAAEKQALDDAHGFVMATVGTLTGQIERSGHEIERPVRRVVPAAPTSTTGPPTRPPASVQDPTTSGSEGPLGPLAQTSAFVSSAGTHEQPPAVPLSTAEGRGFRPGR